MKSRTSLPTSKVHQHISNISNARLKQLQHCNYGISEVSINQPFNPRLQDPLKQNTQVLTNKRVPGPVKNQKLNVGDNNIALYDMRGNEIPDVIKTSLNKKLQDDNKQRTDLEINSHRYAQSLNKDNTFCIAENSAGEIKYSKFSNNYRPATTYKTISEVYNPMLPESATNKRPANMPAVVDERIDRKRNEREYLYESDQENLNIQCLKSDDVQRRQQLQKEMLESNRGGAGLNRWMNDDKKSYMHNTQQGYYKDANINSTKSSRALTSIETENHGYINREIFDSNANKNIISSIQTSTIDQTQQHTHNINNTRKNTREAYDDKNNTSKGFFSAMIDGIKDVLGIKKNSSKNIVDNGEERSAYNGSNDYSTEHLTDILSSEAFQVYSKQTDHVKLFVNRDMDRPVIIDGADEYSNSAAGIITLDKDTANTFRIQKSVAFIQDGKFIVVQKREQDSVFGGDMNKIGDDLLVTFIPLEALDTSFRQRLDTMNKYSTKRAEPLQMTYEDYLQTVDFINEHPETQQRMSVKTVYDNIRGFDYERDINNSFTTQSTTFVESVVKDKLVDKIRTHMSDKITTRAAPASSLEPFVNTTSNTNDLKTRVRGTSTTSIKRNINHSTQRSKKLTANPFN